MPTGKVVNNFENTALYRLTLSWWHLVHVRWHPAWVPGWATTMRRLLLLLEFHQELLIVFDLVEDVLLTLGVLFAAER